MTGVAHDAFTVYSRRRLDQHVNAHNSRASVFSGAVQRPEGVKLHGKVVRVQFTPKSISNRFPWLLPAPGQALAQQPPAPAATPGRHWGLQTTAWLAPHRSTAAAPPTRRRIPAAAARGETAEPHLRGGGGGGCLALALGLRSATVWSGGRGGVAAARGSPRECSAGKPGGVLLTGRGLSAAGCSPPTVGSSESHVWACVEV